MIPWVTLSSSSTHLLLTKSLLKRWAACLLNLLLLLSTEAALGHSVRCTVPKDLDRNRLSRAGSLSQSGLPDGLSHSFAQGNPELDQLLESRVTELQFMSHVRQPSSSG